MTMGTTNVEDFKLKLFPRMSKGNKGPTYSKLSQVINKVYKSITLGVKGGNI